MRPRNALFCSTLVLIGLAVSLSGCGREAPSFAPGSLTVVSTPPGAAILIDGLETGHVTPHTFSGLDADLYTVSVALPTYVASPGEIPVDLAPLDDLTLEFNLSQTGLFVTSAPLGARILVDGADSGQTTPATLVGLAAGPVEISLDLATYLVTPAATTVDVVAGRVDTLTAATFALRPQRTMILEGFSNVDCAPCPQLTANLLDLTGRPEYDRDRVLFLEFSVSWPNISDPLFQYNAAENADRYTDYFVLGAPALYTNGTKMDDPLDMDAVEVQMATDLAVDPGFVIDVTASFVNPLVPTTVTLVPAGDVDLTGHTLFVALYEKVVDFTERGLSAGSNGQTEFHHVFRDRVDAPPALGALTAGVPAVFDLNLARGDWALDNLAVVAFVQRNSDLAIIQAGAFGDPAAKTGAVR